MIPSTNELKEAKKLSLFISIFCITFSSWNYLAPTDANCLWIAMATSTTHCQTMRCACRMTNIKDTQQIACGALLTKSMLWFISSHCYIQFCNENTSLFVNCSIGVSTVNRWLPLICICTGWPNIGSNTPMKHNTKKIIILIFIFFSKLNKNMLSFRPINQAK